MKFRYCIREVPAVIVIVACLLIVFFMTPLREEVPQDVNEHAHRKDFMAELRKELEASLKRTRQFYSGTNRELDKMSNKIVSSTPVATDAPNTSTRTTIATPTKVTRIPWKTSSRNGNATQKIYLDADTFKTVQNRFEDRRRMLQNVCEINHKDFNTYQRCELDLAKYNYKYVEDAHLLYCAIEKTGSTFWKRISHVIGGWGNTSNPTDIGSDAAHSENGGFKVMKNNTFSDIELAFANSTNIMFVRDPFTRLFSAWLDKFYSPNAYFWNVTGREIVKEVRPTSTKDSPFTCPHDISFTEFVSFIVSKNKLSLLKKGCVDGHFAPNYKHCLPCSKNLTYHYIGKYETLKEDTFYLLNKLNLSETVTFSNFERDAAYDAIHDLTYWVYAEKEHIAKCGVSFRCALFKTWKRLQSRGIIGKESSFPYKSDAEVERVSIETILMDMVEANRIAERVQLRKNRNEAIVKAFKSLPKDVLEEFKDVFRIDFEMFGYSFEPAYLNVSDSQLDGFNFFERCPDV